HRPDVHQRLHRDGGRSGRLSVELRTLRRLLVAGLAGLAFVSAAACGAHVAPPAPGSAASPGAGPNATPGAAPGGVADQEAARQTVEAFFEGIITGNSKSVCGLMTAQAVADAAQAARS